MSVPLFDDGKRRYDEEVPQVDGTVIKQSETDDDPRLGISDVMFERDVVTDLLAGAPGGHSIEQTLGLGLDGAAIDTAPDHDGVGDDDLLAGRSIDSPLAMARDGLFGDTGAASTGAPPDTSTGSADPTNNMDLVAGTDGGTAGGTDDKSYYEQLKDWGAKKLQGDTDAAPDAGTVRPPGDTPIPTPKAPTTIPPFNPSGGWMTNPDADTGGTGGTATDADIERAIAKQGGGDTRVVDGSTRGPVITGDSPTTRPIDLVRDPVDDDQGSGSVKVTGSDPGHLPQDEIIHTVNPGDGLLPPALEPRPGPGGEPGTGGDVLGMGSESSAATATDAGSASGVINIGTGSTGGINTVEGDGGGVAGTPPTDVLGLASESFAMMGGDDDDLDELEVQRVDMAAAGPGTQTEDEIYIGATSAPVEPGAAGSNGGSAGGDPAAQPSVAAPLPTATVAGVVAPMIEFEPIQAGPEPDALTVTIDASTDLQSTFDNVFESVFESALTPLPDDAEARLDEPASDDGF